MGWGLDNEFFGDALTLDKFFLALLVLPVSQWSLVVLGESQRQHLIISKALWRRPLVLLVLLWVWSDLVLGSGLGKGTEGSLGSFYC